MKYFLTNFSKWEVEDYYQLNVLLFVIGVSIGGPLDFQYHSSALVSLLLCCAGFAW